MRFYGIDLDQVGSAVSVSTAAACAASLPKESLVVARVNEKSTVSYSDVLLNAIASMLAGRHIDFPWEHSESSNGALPEFEHSTIEDFDEWYKNTKFDRSEEWQTL